MYRFLLQIGLFIVDFSNLEIVLKGLFIFLFEDAPEVILNEKISIYVSELVKPEYHCLKFQNKIQPKFKKLNKMRNNIAHKCINMELNEIEEINKKIKL